MATIDTQNNIIVLHIVYDGVTAAGKTACIHALRTILRKDMPIFSPADSDAGETLYFDWMEYQGGYFKGGYNILCQIISVPGLAKLEARRHFLLELADVVIFVADASNVTETTIDYFQELQDIVPLDNEPFKIVVQANKQDLEDVVPTEHWRELLPDPEVRIIDTCAITGMGIREAFVMAVSLAIKRADGLMSKGRLRFGAPDISSKEALLESLSKIAEVESKPVIPAQVGENLIKMPISSNYSTEQTVLTQEDVLDIEESELADATLEILAQEAILTQEDDVLIEESELEDVTLEELAQDDAELEMLAQEAVLAQEDDVLIEESELEDVTLEELAQDDVKLEQLAEDAHVAGMPTTANSLHNQDVHKSQRLPILPEENPPLQWISPPLAGRKILQDMFSYPLKPHLTEHDTWTIDAANQWYCLSKLEWQYSDENQACIALRDFTALQLHYSLLLPEQRCLVLSQQEQNWRLWQITHRMPNLNELLTQALKESELERLVLETFRCASRYIEVCRKSAEYSPRLNVCLDTIGVDSGAHLVYLGSLEDQGNHSVCLSEDGIKTMIKQNFTSPIHHAIRQSKINVERVLDEFDQIQPFDSDITVVQALTEVFATAV
ncbi:MAG: GTPase domain-containing protein [Thiotrichaceae bacterium]